MSNMNYSIDPDRYTIKTIDDLRQAKQHMLEMKHVGLAGQLNYDALKTDETEIVDKFGNKLNLDDLHLVFSGSLADPPPKMDANAMKSFSIAVARAATFNQRNLPIWKKLVIVWQVFAELFLGKGEAVSRDPYIQVAQDWCASQDGARSKTKRERLTMFKNRILDMFIHSPNVDDLETFGLPGFRPIKRR